MQNQSSVFCQSCAMPMDTADSHGTHADGSPSENYCVYCYKDGHFTANVSMEEMIRLCAPHMASAHSGMSEAEAIEQMRQIFPKLERWAKE